MLVNTNRLAALMSLLLIVLSLLSLVTDAGETNDVDLSLDFEHSIGNGDDDSVWHSRGNKVKYVVNKAEKKLSVKFENPTFKLNADEIIKLQSGWMRVRIPVVNTEGAVVPNKYLVTSVKGCALVQDPKEVFSLLTDKTGALVGLQYERPLISDCSDQPLPTELEIASKVIAVLPKEAPAMPLPKMEADPMKEGKLGDKDDQTVAAAPKSFLQEYWYLILPSIVLYTLMTAPKDAPVDPAAQQVIQPSAAATVASASVAGAVTGGAKRRKGATVGQ